MLLFYSEFVAILKHALQSILQIRFRSRYRSFPAILFLTFFVIFSQSQSATASGFSDGHGYKPSPPPSCTACHIFGMEIPPSETMNDGFALELGVKFQSSIAGYITGIRFYKTTGNTGKHIGELYGMDQTKLASATFTGETGTGWQDVNFSSPVAIAANTTYIAAYWSSEGNYVDSVNYFSAAVVNSPVTALADGTDGPNAVYAYTAAAAYPGASAGNKPNYWVDVNFSEALPAAIANAGNDQTITSPVSSVTLDGSASAGSVNSYLWSFISGPNTQAISTANAAQAGLSGMIAGTYLFELSLNGGVSTSRIAVNVLPAGSFINIFTTQHPAGPVLNDGKPLEVGVKFQTSQTGYIKGIRFYKSDGNTGIHIGELYTSAGSLLGSATFTSETSSGWQTVLFPSAVPVAANTTYVASCWSSEGNFSLTANYFTSAMVNSPLTALADGTDGPNGVYEYTNSAAFPTKPGDKQPNYWVDVEFTRAADPAPVQYMGFTGTVHGKNVDLQWITSTEKNNKGFEVQRSVDTLVWTTLGFVAGLGNSATPATYTFSDVNLPASGMYYYRLRQVDSAGQSYFSKTISVQYNAEVLMLELKQNQPNPVTNTAVIGIVLPKGGRAQLMLYDQMGRPLKILLDEEKLPGTYWIQMNRSGLSAGMYYYKLQVAGEIRIKKMSVF